ncbi:MAG: penicillin-binding protein activator LpoB [Planctomycetes bacterium]|nr:penicillin-binding protein activator LpoB [Planctomycetota bacterium]
MALPLVIVLSGCASGNARYVETGNQENIVSVGEVDIQDIQKAAAGMLDSLLETGTLKRAARTPALLAIDKVVNDTSSQFDTGELLYRMREQLVNSGQAQVVTVWGANAEDATAKDAATREAFLTGTTGGVQKPDFSLTGKITQIKRQAGQTRQTTYTFRLTLTSMTSGSEVWTKNVDVTKQGVRNSVGW